MFEAARFRDIEVEKLSAPFRVPSVADYLDFVRTSASPVVDILSCLDPEAQRLAWSEIASKLRDFEEGHGWEGPNELIVCSGRRES